MSMGQGKTLAIRHAKGVAQVAILAACLGMPIAGCAGKNEPSAANFERALNTVLQKAIEKGDCYGSKVSVMSRKTMEEEYFPLMEPRFAGQLRSAVAANQTKILVHSTSGPFGQKKAPDAEQAALFRALKEGGLVMNGEIYAYTSPPPWSTSYATVALNEAGMRQFREQKVKLPGGGFETRHMLCYGGTIKVDKIVRWTEPADKNGFKMTMVEFTAVPSDIHGWATPLLQFDTDMKKSHTVPLVLTNEGWSADMGSGR